MSGTRPELTLQIVGPLTVVADDGSDRTPKGQRAKGLLALLALAPNGRRARTWLQDKLWSGRDSQHGGQSMRQALTEVRNALGTARHCLVSDGKMVALDLERVKISHSIANAGLGRLQPDVAILFEGLDINDVEFEAWLCEQRSKFETQLQASQGRTPVVGPEILSPEASAGDRLQLVLRPRSLNTEPRERVVADSLTDIIARTVSELGHVDVIDLRNADRDAGNGSVPRIGATAISADAAEDASGILCRVTLTSAHDNHLVWSIGVRSRTGALIAEDPAALRELNQMVEQVYRHFASVGKARELRVAALLCRQGIDQMFKLQESDLLLADRLFERAYEMEPRGIYLAWRAYLRTIQIVELIPTERHALAEEALAMTRRALELDPANSYIASICAHVQSIVRQSHVAAFEFAERSVQLNPANPLGWASLGIAECYLGNTRIGFEHALHARQLSAMTPFRFFVNGQASVAGSMAGDVDSAIFLAESSHGVSPRFKPPMRFLSALYLLRDRHEESQQMVDRVRLSEPGFSYELLRDKSYPASSLHRSGLLTKLPGRQV